MHKNLKYYTNNLTIIAVNGNLTSNTFIKKEGGGGKKRKKEIVTESPFLEVCEIHSNIVENLAIKKINK